MALNDVFEYDDYNRTARLKGKPIRVECFSILESMARSPTAVQVRRISYYFGGLFKFTSIVKTIGNLKPVVDGYTLEDAKRYTNFVFGSRGLLGDVPEEEIFINEDNFYDWYISFIIPYSNTL